MSESPKIVQMPNTNQWYKKRHKSKVSRFLMLLSKHFTSNFSTLVVPAPLKDLHVSAFTKHPGQVSQNSIYDFSTCDRNDLLFHQHIAFFTVSST